MEGTSITSALARGAATVLRPGTVGLGRLRYAHKFALIGLVLLAPLVYVGHAYLAQQNATIGFSTKERAGVVAVQPLNELLAALADARSAAVRGASPSPAAVRTAEEAVDGAVAHVGATLAIEDQWSGLRRRIDATLSSPPGTPAQALTAYGALTAGTTNLIVAAGNSSNLILDPDLDSFYVMDALITKLPPLVDQASTAADREYLLAGARSPSRPGSSSRSPRAVSRAARPPSTRTTRPRSRIPTTRGSSPTWAPAPAPPSPRSARSAARSPARPPAASPAPTA